MIKRPTKKEWMKDLAMPVLPEDLPEYHAGDDMKLFDPKTDTTTFVPPTTTKYIEEKGNELSNILNTR
jgi:hypothetical protein